MKVVYLALCLSSYFYFATEHIDLDKKKKNLCAQLFLWLCTLEEETIWSVHLELL